MNDLIKKAQHGDLLAFENLVKEYDSRILALAYQISRNRQDAEDIYQEVFLRVYKNIGSFKFNCNFYTWLYKITTNCSLTYISKRNRMTQVPLESSSPDQYYRAVDSEPLPDQDVLNQELQHQIQNVVDTMPQMQRTTFILRFYHQQKIKEIAWIMGCSEGTIKNYIFRATSKLKKELSSYIV